MAAGRLPAALPETWYRSCRDPLTVAFKIPCDKGGTGTSQKIQFSQYLGEQDLEMICQFTRDTHDTCGTVKPETPVCYSYILNSCV